MNKYFRRLYRTILSFYTKWNLFWQLVAFLLTYIISTSGFDWLYFQSTRGETLQSFLFPAAIIGFFTPLFLPIIIYSIGTVKKKMMLVYTSYALTEAGILSLIISSTYKVFTGRPGPHGFGLINTVDDISKVFRFGFYRGGAFQGWPSSHTTVAFAMSFVLVTLFPKNKLVKYFAIIYALYIGIGVSTNIHWFSDFVAGAILGTIIGIGVGKSFLELYKSNNKDKK
jgi:membrane-associated phospholipid phosphatase